MSRTPSGTSAGVGALYINGACGLGFRMQVIEPTQFFLHGPIHASWFSDHSYNQRGASMSFVRSLFRVTTASIVLLAASFSAQAALVFNFSITNTIGTVSGTVTGTIYGLTDNSTGAATSVTIDTFPSGLDSIFGSGPIDATLWDQQLENSFTVAGGLVTTGGFWAQQTVGGFPQGAQLYINGDGGPYNFVNIDGDDTRYVWGDDGFAAANIVPAGTNGVPEPASIALLGIALAGLGWSRRSKV